jgi:hypothetical protein
LAPQNIDFERPFTYVFKDPNWANRLLVGGLFQLLGLLLVGVVIVLGYNKRLFMALVEDENAPLPLFDVPRDLAEGLPVAGIYAFYIGAAFLLTLIPCIGNCLGPLIFLGLVAVLPAALVRYYATGQFAAAFEPNEIIAFIKDNANNIAIYGAIALVAGMAGMFGLIACLIGIFFTSFWGGLVTTRALADLYRQSLVQPPLVVAQVADVPPAG